MEGAESAKEIEIEKGKENANIREKYVKELPDSIHTNTSNVQLIHVADILHKNDLYTVSLSRESEQKSCS